MITRCLILDDEPLARDLMRNHINKLENFEIVAECSNAMKALNQLSVQPVDLMFMDIHMPQISGIDFLKTLHNPPKVIITTAHQKYAIEGFELDVIDFLLKPITFERFLKAVNKYYQSDHPGNQKILSERKPVTAMPASEENFIYVKENKKMIKVQLSDILYIEGLSEYVQIITSTRKIITKNSMNNMDSRLPDTDFVRIHKSYIVSLAKIQAFTSSSIEIPGKTLPIGRSYKNAVSETLQLKS